MIPGTPLSYLGELSGIVPFYWDVYGGYHETSDNTRRKFLAAMGYPAENDDAVAASVLMIEERPWRRMIEPVTVLSTTDEISHRIIESNILMVLPEGQTDSELYWFVDLENGQCLEGSVCVSELAVAERRDIDGQARLRIIIPLPENLPHGYHRVRVRLGQSTAGGALIITPPSAYRPGWLNEKPERIWGIACQLYALRSSSNWGMGDLGDLASLCEKAAGYGCDAIGLPPLHALFPARQGHLSPYSPSSRILLNPLYIDVTAVPEYVDCREARAIVESANFTARIDSARASDMVDFAEVSDLKLNILNVLFRHFTKIHPPGSKSKRRQDLENFISECGERLNQLALFETLQEHFSPQPIEQWPVQYRTINSAKTLELPSALRSRVAFHIYLQWEADRQLAAAAETCSKNGMQIGLYRDLSVGVAAAGADAWIYPNAFLGDMHFGAPPDPLGLTGQDWGMPPFSPVHLYESAYGSYVDMLRANMRHAGAVRLDHVMWLQQMFWIPPGGDGRDGAYVRYPFDDLLAILTLESHRNQCLVIGEALGTVPEGFRERLTAKGILSYRLLHFERHQNGLYKQPGAYPTLALAKPASHDFPTLAGFWRETDIKVQLEIGLIASEDVAVEQRRLRARKRALLIGALADQELLPHDFPNSPDIEDAELKNLIAAIHCFLARSSAALMVMNLEDIMMSTTQVNIPGTIDEYPNWRLKLPFDIDQIFDAAGLPEIADRLRRERTGVNA